MQERRSADHGHAGFRINTEPAQPSGKQPAHEQRAARRLQESCKILVVENLCNSK